MRSILFISIIAAAALGAQGCKPGLDCLQVDQLRWEHRLVTQTPASSSLMVEADGDVKYEKKWDRCVQVIETRVNKADAERLLRGVCVDVNLNNPDKPDPCVGAEEIITLQDGDKVLARTGNIACDPRLSASKRAIQRFIEDLPQATPRCD